MTKFSLIFDLDTGNKQHVTPSDYTFQDVLKILIRNRKHFGRNVWVDYACSASVSGDSGSESEKHSLEYPEPNSD